MFDYDVSGKRILEVGCGMALSSLLLNHRLADITATDYHPEVQGFLSENVRLNQDREIPFKRTGWADEISDLGEFDLIIGSDLLYETGHADLLSGFINQHARRHCEVILVDPDRGHHARFSKKMVALGYSHSQNRPENVTYLDKPFKGQILHYHR
jgi:predicted nicotinamide N-methyase